MAEQADKCDEAARRILGAIEQNHRKVCWCTDSDKQKVAAIIREVVAEPLQERAADHLKSLRVAADKATLLADWLRDWAE